MGGSPVLSNTLILGALLMLVGVLHSHAKGMAACEGDTPEQKVWKGTAQWAVILFIVVVALSCVDLFLMWRAP
jgi:hypothetical protein